jgi:hypothetical protein
MASHPSEAPIPRISFTDHPASVGETYAEHLRAASGFGFAMIGGGIACLVHGLLPFLFTTVGSRTIGVLHDRMIANRRRPTASPAAESVPPVEPKRRHSAAA